MSSSCMKNLPVSLLLVSCATTSGFHLPSGALTPSTSRRAASPKALAIPTVPAMALTHGAAAISAGSGLFAWIAPKANADGYGLLGDDGIGDSAYYQVRQIGAWQVVNAMVLLSGLKGAQSAASMILIASACSTIACIPANEYFEKPKGPAVLSAIVFMVLGRMTSKGKLGPMVGGGLIALLGGLIHLTPKETASLYQIDPIKISPLFLSMLTATGSTIFCTGAYVMALAAGFAQLRAFGLTMILSAAFAIKFLLTDAEDLGVKTAATVGPLAWRMAAQVALAILALK